MVIMGRSWILVATTILFLLLQGEDCLRINDLIVPNVVENGSEPAVVLDCDYSFDNADLRGLVVKWFFDDGETPVYQWIPPKLPQDFGKLKRTSDPFPYCLQLGNLPPSPSPEDMRQVLADAVANQHGPKELAGEQYSSIRRLITKHPQATPNHFFRMKVPNEFSQLVRETIQSGVPQSKNDLLPPLSNNAWSLPLYSNPCMTAAHYSKDEKKPVCIQFINIDSKTLDDMKCNHVDEKLRTSQQ